MSNKWVRDHLPALKMIQDESERISIDAYDFNNEGKWAGVLIWTKNSNTWRAMLNTAPKFDTMEDALWAMGRALKKILKLDLSATEARP